MDNSSASIKSKIGTNSNGIPVLKLQDLFDLPQELTILELENLPQHVIELTTQSHRIDFNEIILFTHGCGELCVDSKNYDFSARSFFSVSKGQVQMFYDYSETKGYLIMFSDQLCYINNTDYKWKMNLKLFDTCENSPLVNLSEQDYRELLLYTILLQSEIRNRNTYAKDMLIMNILKVILLKAENIKREQINFHAENNKDFILLQEFKQLLEEFYPTNRSVQFYADSLFITARKLNQVTRSYWGKSAKDIIEERILLEIKRRLLHTDQTVKEISQTVGFSDPTNFNKFFKRFTKISPAKYRAEITNTD